EQACINPDFMCLSKGLTGGFMPMSAVLTTQHVYESFLDDSRERAFLHSHSYTGNPLACAAALASFTIFSSDNILEHNKITAQKMAAHAEHFKGHPHVAEVRQTGMILAIEMVQDKKSRTAFAAGERRGLRAYQHAIANGVVLRPLGDILYWMPPYCIDDEALQHLSSVTASALNEATR
ncbi:MAG: aminotransferase class III-fold pyridoxal phosphate-dependent enzyme, partial [Methylococcales bacterium]